MLTSPAKSIANLVVISANADYSIKLSIPAANASTTTQNYVVIIPASFTITISGIIIGTTKTFGVDV